jgi:hypothetical protein
MRAYRLRLTPVSLMVLGLGGLAGSGGCSSSGGGGTGGAGGGATDAAAEVAIDTGPRNCAGMAISLASNVSVGADTAKSRVMVDFTDPADTDLPLGNSPRTIEFWAFVPGDSWRGDVNTMFEYGNQSVGNAGFGLDFGTTTGGTIDPYTNGTFDNDNQPSGITDFTTDQWIHFAMTYDQTAVMLYVNGNYVAGMQGSRRTVTGGMLATARTMLTIGGNPRGAYFSGKLDEFRMWNVARSQADIMAKMNTTVASDEPGLVGYWKFDDGTGTTAMDSVTSTGHVAHDGAFMATTAAMNPVWVDSTAPIVCP